MLKVGPEERGVVSRPIQDLFVAAEFVAAEIAVNFHGFACP